MSIWKHREIKNSIEENANLITLDEGDTPVEELTHDTNKIYLKREDKNPTGSWKDRGTAYKLTKLLEQGATEAVIASSGNAAISFLTYANELSNKKNKNKKTEKTKDDEITLHVVVSPDINETKREILEELVKGTNHKLHFETKAKSFAAKLAGEKNIPNLRSSLDSDILKGYWSLGFELYDICKKNRDKEIFIICPVSSGTALVGLTEGLFMKIEDEFKMPRIIACQTQSCHPLLDNVATSEEKSLADAIVDKSVLRKPQIEKIIKQTNGKVLNITNDELLDAQSSELIAHSSLSFTSLLPVAGFMKLQDDVADSIFILITSGR